MVVCIKKAPLGVGAFFRCMIILNSEGDCIWWGYCLQSRNFSFGVEIGKTGRASEIIKENTKTVEGVYTTRAVVKRAKELNIEMPISEVMEKILFDGLSLKDGMSELLGRPYKIEG